MRIIVLNGSPKGAKSVTLQYVRYIQKKHPEHELKIIHVSQLIKKIERDEPFFRSIIEDIEVSEAVIWATPV
jgi:NAD(P)H-dependent FMN reductase